MKGFLRSKLILSLVTVVMIETAVLILLSGNAIHSQAAGTDLYVNASTGSDSNNGSQSAPFATIAKAASLVTPATTVHVAPGTYNTAVLSDPNGTAGIITHASGTATARIVYVSDTKWGAHIYNTGARFTWQNYGSYVDIDGFDISGVKGAGLVRVGIGSLGSYVRIIGNHVHDIEGGCDSFGGEGIGPYGTSATNTDTIGNVVNNNGSYPTECDGIQGIYYSSPNGRILNNITYHNACSGITNWHWASANIIMNNLSFENACHGIQVGTDTNDTGGVLGDYFVVANNISINNADLGIRERVGVGSHNQYVNNILYGNGVAAFGDETWHIWNPSPAGSYDVGTITADAQFVNYAGGDYHLKSTSPAIVVGIASLTGAIANGGTFTPLVVNAPTTDFDGNTRPQGAGYDIGPYEYMVPVTSTPTIAPTNTPTPPLIPSPTPTTVPTPTSSDTPPPTVSLTSLVNGTTVPRHSIVTISATAKNNVGVTKVEFLVNGSLLCTDTTAPYICNWSVPAKPGVKYTITASAYDPAGNVSSQSITASSG